jgi:hypothetical protein
MYCNITMRRVSVTIAHVEKQELLNVSVCFLVLVISRNVKCLRHIILLLWPVRLYSIFPHYLINYTIFGKTLLYTECILFFLQRLSEIFLILRIVQLDIIMYLCLHVGCPHFLSDFNKT